MGTSAFCTSIRGLIDQVTNEEGAVTHVVSVYNLFGTTYMHPVGAELVQAAIAQDGRPAAVRATIKF